MTARGLLLEGVLSPVGSGLLEVDGLCVRMNHQNLLGWQQNGKRLIDSTSLLGYNSKDAGTQNQMGKCGMRLGMKGRLGSMKEAFLHWKGQLLQVSIGFSNFYHQHCKGPNLNRWEKTEQVLCALTKEKASFKM